MERNIKEGKRIPEMTIKVLYSFYLELCLSNTKWRSSNASK